MPSGTVADLTYKQDPGRPGPSGKLAPPSWNRGVLEPPGGVLEPPGGVLEPPGASSAKKNAPGEPQGRPRGAEKAKWHPKSFRKSSQNPSTLGLTFSRPPFGGGGLPPPLPPPPLDPLASRTPKNDQGSDPNSKNNATAHFTRVLSAPRVPYGLHLGTCWIRVRTVIPKCAKFD